MVPLPRHQSGLVPEKCGAKRRTGEKNQRNKRGFHLIIDVFMKYLRQGYSLAPSGNFDLPNAYHVQNWVTQEKV
jgi:hypothetical protein